MISTAVRRALVAAALVAVAARSGAQPLDDAVNRLLTEDCAGLGVPGGNDNFPGSLGANLDAICEQNMGGGPPIGTSAGGGAAPAPGSETAITRQRAEERLESERHESEAAADTGVRPDFARLFTVERLGLWVTGDAEDRRRDRTRFEDGYDGALWTASAGADYRFAESLFAGLAFQYQHTGGDFDAGGDFETDSLGGVLYGSYAPLANAFLDVVVGYAAKEYDVVRAVAFAEVDPTSPAGGGLADVSGFADGEADGDEVQARGLLGYDFALGSLELGPRAGVSFVHTRIDGYRESGGTGLELVYDDRHRQSLQSVLGGNVSIAGSTDFGVIVPELDLEWIHEFQDDRRGTSVRFAEDLRAAPTVFRFENDRPDRDFFQLAAGLSLVLPRGVQAFARFRTLLGHDHFDGYGVSIGVRIAIGGGGA